MLNLFLNQLLLCCVAGQPVAPPSTPPNLTLPPEPPGLATPVAPVPKPPAVPQPSLAKPSEASPPSNLSRPAAAKAAAEATPFSFKDGDRVILLGDSVIEQEQCCGYLEEELTVCCPDRQVRFRNLAWGAHDPLELLRTGSDWTKSRDKYFRRLTRQIAAFKPTVAILGYGTAASLQGEAGLPRFQSELNRLIDVIRSLGGGADVRLVLLGPIRHEALAHSPEAIEHNTHLTNYNRAVKEIAEARGCRFVDLFVWGTVEARVHKDRRLTSDGVHLTPFGYWRLADQVTRSLLGFVPGWRFGVLPDGTLRAGGYGTKTLQVNRQRGVMRIELEEEYLPPSIPPDWQAVASREYPHCYVQFQKLEPGSYTLSIDGRAVHTYEAKEWLQGAPIFRGPQWDQAEELRQAIIRKNQLFFKQWRPEDGPLLFGFRGGEPASRVKAGARVDGRILKLEQWIAKLRRPGRHSMVLERTRDGAPQAASPKGQTSAPKDALPPIPPPNQGTRHPRPARRF